MLDFYFRSRDERASCPGRDAALIAACAAFLGHVHAYRAACEAEVPLDGNPSALGKLRERLSDMRVQKDAWLATISGMPAQTAAGRRAKGDALLAAFESLDSSPEGDLAISLARDNGGQRGFQAAFF